MTNVETNDKAATVAAQGAQVAPDKPTSKKAASRRKSGQGHKSRQGSPAQKASKGQQEGR